MKQHELINQLSYSGCSVLRCTTLTVHTDELLHCRFHVIVRHERQLPHVSRLELGIEGRSHIGDYLFDFPRDAHPVLHAELGRSRACRANGFPKGEPSVLPTRHGYLSFVRFNQLSSLMLPAKGGVDGFYVLSW